jgi:hypothetical protein
LHEVGSSSIVNACPHVSVSGRGEDCSNRIESSRYARTTEGNGKMKMKRMILSAALLTSVLGVAVGPATANNAGRNCPDSFQRVPESEREEGPSIDRNGDDLVCQRALPGVGNVGFFNVIDNNAR